MGASWVVCIWLGLKFVPKRQEVKFLEALTICFGLENLSSIHISNIVVEFAWLEVINFFNDISVDFSKVSFFIEETKDRGSGLGLSRSLMFAVVNMCWRIMLHVKFWRIESLQFFLLLILSSLYYLCMTRDIIKQLVGFCCIAS